MGGCRNELCVDAAPVSIRPADRTALIRTTDLPAERLPSVDVLAVERDPARSPACAGNEAEEDPGRISVVLIRLVVGF
jgi:hypothetical protein